MVNSILCLGYLVFIHTWRHPLLAIYVLSVIHTMDRQYMVTRILVVIGSQSGLIIICSLGLWSQKFLFFISFVLLGQSTGFWLPTSSPSASFSITLTGTQPFFFQMHLLYWLELLLFGVGHNYVVAPKIFYIIILIINN